MEQVPHVAVYCYEHHSMMEAVPQYILFIVLRFLTDSNNQVSTNITNKFRIPISQICDFLYRNWTSTLYSRATCAAGL